MKNATFIAVVCAVACISATGQLDPVTGTIGYQGTLMQSDGITPEIGPVNIEFRLYSNKEDGTPVWAELHEDVTLVDGIFSVELGAGVPLDGSPHTELVGVFVSEPLWLGIGISGEAERVERQQFTSAPYALTANTAITAVHGVPPGTLAVWAGEEPPVGWLSCDGESYPRDGDYSKLFAAIGTVWGEGDEPGVTFSVPNLGGRTPIGAMEAGQGQNANSPGANPTEAGLTGHELGDLLGEESHQLTVPEMATHAHGYTDRHWTGSESSEWGAGHAMSSTYVDTLRHTTYTGGVDTNNDGTPDAAADHNNMQPSLVMHFIIKY